MRVAVGPSARTARPKKVFLFLQGPVSPFFARLATTLEMRGHAVLRVNFNVGDALFWRRAGAIAFRGRRRDWPAFVAALMDRHGVTDVVLLGEQRYYHRAAVAAARQRGIAVTVTDFGYLRPDWITFERDGMSGDSHFPKDPAAIHKLARHLPEPDLAIRFRDSFCNMALWDLIYHFAVSFLWFLYPHYRFHGLYHPMLVHLGAGLRHLLRPWRGRRANRLVRAMRTSGAPYFLFPLQLESDFQVRAYSPYPDLKTPIREVIGSFARWAPPQSRLIIKVHPLDPGQVNWRRCVDDAAVAAGAAERVHVIDGGCLSTAVAGARGIVTINSTVGLWALRAGRPVVTLGEAIFDIVGLTYQGSLDRFWCEASPPDPSLRNAFVRALAGTIQLRGVYYRQPGLDAAVAAAADRLDRALVNEPVSPPLEEPVRLRGALA
jgi:capsular polysaccharide export protein